MNSGRDAFSRFAAQLQARSRAGGGGTPGGKGLFAGTGLIVALVAGGVALNASMFNGTRFCFSKLLRHLLKGTRF